jgi:hypothetical protein
MTQDLFPASFAERLKARAGQKYRPSNGTEGEMFQERWCYDCTKDTDQNCSILLRAFWADIDEPEYPAEWQYGPDGQPRCTAFHRIGTEEPHKPLPGQMEMFE